jgi:hypothetical protein
VTCGRPLSLEASSGRCVDGRVHRHPRLGRAGDREIRDEDLERLVVLAAEPLEPVARFGHIVARAVGISIDPDEVAFAVDAA